MRTILLPLMLLSVAAPVAAQTMPPQTQTQPARPEPQQVVTNVLAISASTAGRLLFWIRVPGAPPEGRRFRIRPDREFPWGGSGVMGLLMASYQTSRLIRIFYIPAANPEGVGEIVGVDTLHAVQIPPVQP